MTKQNRATRGWEGRYEAYIFLYDEMRAIVSKLVKQSHAMLTEDFWRAHARNLWEWGWKSDIACRHIKLVFFCPNGAHFACWYKDISFIWWMQRILFADQFDLLVYEVFVGSRVPIESSEKRQLTVVYLWSRRGSYFGTLGKVFLYNDLPVAK